EGITTSQFEQHVRAICGLPRGSVEPRAGGMATVNILGTGVDREARPTGLAAALAMPDIHIHLYDKRRVFERRKMGHVTALAAKTLLPVVGVPVPTQHLGGLDSLLSIVQMPRGIPVATVAIGNAENAALLAVEILALSDSGLAGRLADWRASQTQAVLDDPSNAEGAAAEAR